MKKKEAFKNFTIVGIAILLYCAIMIGFLYVVHEKNILILSTNLWTAVFIYFFMNVWKKKESRETINFIPRFVCPSKSNSYYNSDINPYVKNGYGMFQNGGNCTCYAYGRFYELSKEKPSLYTGNAKNWYPYVQDGYERGETPKLGAIICFYASGNKGGHVAVVEEIEKDGSIITSNSGYQSSMFYLQTLKAPYYIGSDYEFQGFIYNPINFMEGIVSEFQEYLNQTYGYHLVVDNSFGPDTRKHAVMALQTEMNRQYGSGLVVDGSFGPKTKEACIGKDLYLGSKGNITRLVQYLLLIKGYSLGSYGADGSYGYVTENAIKKFQKDCGLKVDGYCGPNTFEKLFQ